MTENARVLNNSIQELCSVCRERTANQPNSSRPERIRVLHVFNYLGMGGTELAAIRVIKSLGSDFQHRICALRGYNADLMASQYPGADVVSPFEGTKSYQFMLFRLMTIMQEYRPHIVHSRNWGTIEAIPAAKLAGVPAVIHSEHGYEMDLLTTMPLRRRVFRKAAYSMADLVLTVSEELRRFHARQAWISAERIRVIHNGVDTEQFCAEFQRTADENLGTQGHPLVIGTVGRLVPIKNQAMLLRAADLLVGRGVDVHVLIVGSGPDMAGHRQLVASSPALAGRVSFLGTVTNVEKSLNAMDVFVLPSISEGISNTLLEAMSCALPVVAARVGGNPEIVEENLSGLLFTSGNIAELVKCIERLAADRRLRQSLGLAARKRILMHFNMDRMALNYRQLYTNVLLTEGIAKRSVN